MIDFKIIELAYVIVLITSVEIVIIWALIKRLGGKK